MSISTSAGVERLSPAQIERRLEESSVAYIPLGSLEFHGPHLPIGLDALTAHGICLRAAALSGGIVLPPYYQGVGGEHSRYPWTIMSGSPEAIEVLLGETLARLDEFGVRQAVIVSGHFADEQKLLASRVSERWNSGGAALRAVSTTLGDAPGAPEPADHAGVFESLLLLAISPDLVNVDQLPDPLAFPAPSNEDPWGQQRHDTNHPLYGIFGPDPRGLDTKRAEPLLQYMAEWIASLTR